MFERLQKNGLIICLDKCAFSKTSISFLGHQVDSTSVCPLLDKVAAIADFPCPSTSKELSRFLGLINYFHRFIPNAASILKLMHAAVDHKCSLKLITWSDPLSVFETAKTSGVLEQFVKGE